MDSKLIDKFIKCCNDMEDADLIGWMIVLKGTDRQHEVIEFICDIWELDEDEINT